MDLKCGLFRALKAGSSGKIFHKNEEVYIFKHFYSRLVHSVASGSIPIVAGKDGKPDYLRYMPANSYINIYDYASVDALAKHLTSIAADPIEYEKFLWFKRKHEYTREQLALMSLAELKTLAQNIFAPSEKFLGEDGLVQKEKSENKLCKVARYLRDTPSEIVDEQINARRVNRPATSEACLPPGNLAKDFPE